MIVTILLLILLYMVGSYYYAKFGRSGRLIDKIPGPKTKLIFGNILIFQCSQEGLFNIVRELGKSYYPLYRIWSFRTPVVNICNPDDAEILLSSQKHITKSFIYDLLHSWFATGLLTSTGAKWQHRRKILTPAFHFNVLQQFVDVFIEEGERMVEGLQKCEEPIIKDLNPFVSEHTLNAICETAMGTKLQGRGAFQQKYRQAIHDIARILVHRLVRPWIQNDLLFSFTSQYREQTKILRILHGFTKKIIAERKQYHDETNGQYLKDFESNNGPISYDTSDTIPGIRKKKRLAMLDLLIAAHRNNQINDSGICEEVDTFMFEGHDTTGVALTFILMNLAEHKKIQERAREEVETVLKENGGKIDMSALQKLSYLERCIKESLRLYPSVPFISRVIKEEMILKNFTVPPETIMHLHIFDIHRDPNFWPDPHVFDPDRFLPERIQGRHPYSYIPFSAGPRNCIGQRFALLEEKTLTAQLLYNFYLEPIDRLKDVRFSADLVLRAAHPLRMKFIPIHRDS